MPSCRARASKLILVGARRPTAAYFPRIRVICVLTVPTEMRSSADATGLLSDLSQLRSTAISRAVRPGLSAEACCLNVMSPFG